METGGALQRRDSGNGTPVSSAEVTGVAMAEDDPNLRLCCGIRREDFGDVPDDGETLDLRDARVLAPQAMEEWLLEQVRAIDKLDEVVLPLACRGDRLLPLIKLLPPSLKRLSMGDMPPVPAGEFHYLQHFTYLKELKVCGELPGLVTASEERDWEAMADWFRRLPDSIIHIDIIGPGLPLEPMEPMDPKWLINWWGVMVSMRHVTDLTISFLPILVNTMGKIRMGACPAVTFEGLKHLHRLRRQHTLMLYDKVPPGPLDHADGESWLRDMCLPKPPKRQKGKPRVLAKTPRLVSIYAYGMEYPLENLRTKLVLLSELRLYYCSGATNETLRSLPELMPNLNALFIIDCPAVTIKGIQHACNLKKLQFLTLHGELPGLVAAAEGCGPEDVGLFYRTLPESLYSLMISGPETTPEPPRQYRQFGWRLMYKNQPDLYVCIRHGTALTVAPLPQVPVDRLTDLHIGDSPVVIDGKLIPVAQYTKIQALTLHGPLPGLVTDHEQCSPEDAQQWFETLSDTLRYIYISGPEEPEDSFEVARWRDRGNVFAAFRKVTDRLVQCLPGLANRVDEMDLSDCPEVTNDGLRPLGRLTRLKFLLLGGLAAPLSAAAVDGLHGLSRLAWLYLGAWELPDELGIPAEALCSLAAACKTLVYIHTHTTVADGQALVDRMVQTELGNNIFDRPRSIIVSVSKPSFLGLKGPPEDGHVRMLCY